MNLAPFDHDRDLDLLLDAAAEVLAIATERGQWSIAAEAIEVALEVQAQIVREEGRNP